MIISPYLVILRPRQWIKNLMLFFPSFLSGSLFSSCCISQIGIVSFISFCSVSSALYIFNDLNDIERDVLHPIKCLRPLPSGNISKKRAIAIAAFLGLYGLLLAFIVVKPLIPYLFLYGLVTIAYTIWLKDIPIVDLFCISSGFLIRLQAGGELFHVPISPWLFLTVFLLAVFLSTGKRLSETLSLGDMAGEHRMSLAQYPLGFLDGTMYMTAGAVMVTYSMYALNRHTLIYSVPLCLFGLLRYMFRVRSGKSGDPTESLLKDRVLLVVGVLWVLMVVWSIYP